MDEVVEQRVRDVLAKVAPFPRNYEAFSSDADLFRELGVDSSTALDLLLSLEDEFGVAIPDDAFGHARTLRAIAKMVAELDRKK
jgi:acyl carrier protein